MAEAEWHPYEDGASLGETGSEQGRIVADEEHRGGARITLEEVHRGPLQCAITCGLYGWFVHTRYGRSLEEGWRDFEAMKGELGRIVDLLWIDGKAPEQARHAVFEAIGAFVDRFPT